MAAPKQTSNADFLSCIES